MRNICIVLLVLVACNAMVGETVSVPEPALVSKPRVEYVDGGPLAGVKLPCYPTYHGEKPGQPGNSVELEYQLYPESVEHYRTDEIRFFGFSRSKFDIQSMLYNFIAPAIPGNSGKTEKYAQPVREVKRYNGLGSNAGSLLTGKFEPTVEVLAFRPGDRLLNVSVKLTRGIYCVRIVGAVKTTDQNTPVRKPLIGEFTASNGPDGKLTRITKRMNYMDQFYSIGEFFFHAPENREYRLSLGVSPSSEVELLVRNVVIDDALTGVDVRTVKTQSMYEGAVPPEEVVRIQNGILAMDPKKRQILEDIAWDSVLTRDSQCWWAATGDNQTKDYFFYGIPVELLKDTTDLEVNPVFRAVTPHSFEKKYGKWRWHNQNFYNDKLNLTYTIKDFLEEKPLPEPYPLRGSRLGIAAARDNNSKLVYFQPLDGVFGQTRNQWYQNISKFYLLPIARKQQPDRQRNTPEQIYQGLINFVRLAYDFPMMDMEMNENAHQLLAVGPWRRGSLHHRTNYANYLSWYTQYQDYMIVYDKLFPLIKDNQFLADAVGRHVPWVKTPQDVIEIFDSYFVQDIVKRCMRHHYYTMPGSVLTAARVLNYDAKLTSDFIKWSFTSEFRYPMYGGLDYIMQNNLDRAGTAPSSSSYYATLENGIFFGQELVAYSLTSGEKDYCFHDVRRYPKFYNTVYWCVEMLYAGCQFPRIGDVSGPDKRMGEFLYNNRINHEQSWKFWKHPESAAFLYYVFGYQDSEIRRTAEKFTRLPYLNQGSRMIPNWCGIIETGKRHDDFRFRRGAVIRTGSHYGHSHYDSLDLQLSAHGLQMIADGGQRYGYAQPNSTEACVHCTVTAGAGMAKNAINRKEYGCVSSITDSEHFAAMTARSGQGQSVRSIALVDTDDFGSAIKLPIARQIPDAKLDRTVSTPNGYIFDVFREKTQGALLYNFHAANDVTEKFQWNATNETADAKSYGPFPEPGIKAIAPKYFTAQWEIRRFPEMKNGRIVNSAYEQFQMGPNFDPNSPRKFVKLHMVNLSGRDPVQKALYIDRYRGHRMTMIAITATAPKGHAFTAIIEPFAGTPFVKSVVPLVFPTAKGAWDDPVGICVETVNGEKHYNISAIPGHEAVSGAFRLNGAGGVTAQDAKGVRQAVLIGGTLLDTPAVRITAEKAAYAGHIEKVDYLANTMTVNTLWDISRLRLPKVIHVSNRQGLDTSFTVVSAKNENGRTVLQLKEAANTYVSDIKVIQGGRIIGKQPLFAFYEPAGCTVTNATKDKYWKLDGRRSRQLMGLEPVEAKSFAPENLIYYWEYGPGDRVHMDTSVLVERQPDGTYKTVSDTLCEVTIK